MKNIIYLLFLLSGICFSQSTDQNFIKTITYREINTDTTIGLEIDPPPPAQAAISVSYFDGLGRPMQQVAYQQSATGKDIVTPVVYDPWGRQVTEYLPWASDNVNMQYTPNSSAITALIAKYTGIYGTDGQYPWSEKRLEPSPMNRVLEQSAPGNDWKLLPTSDSDHTIKLGYHANGINEVRKFSATASPPTSPPIPVAASYNMVLTDHGHYTASTIYKTITTDENGIQIHEFKNQRGQVVLKRNFKGTTAHDTYYVYDQYGNLGYVIPPLVSGTVDAADLSGLCYQYKYDYRGRLVEKKLPGKQWEFIVYDKLDRVVATGPALSPFSNFRAPNNIGWLVTKYDVFGRPVLTAWKQSATVTAAGRAVLQGTYNNATILHETRSVASTVNSVSFYYTNVAEPVSGYHVLTVNYYDTYQNITWVPNTLVSAVLGQNVYYNHSIQPKGHPAASWVRILESSYLTRNERSYVLYDKKARPIMNYKLNHLGGDDTNYTQYNFVGDVLKNQAVHKRLSGSAPLTTTDSFTYTDQGRLLLHKHKINNLPEELIVKNEYDELGQLKNKKVGGSSITAATFHQKVDYTYNIRGWLKGINDVRQLEQGTNPTDLFAFKLNYNTIESSNNYTGTKLYNGNISETYWLTESDGEVRKYAYQYDDLNRLTDAIYMRPDIPGAINFYNEHVQYDPNGNITRMDRNGYLDGINGSPYPIDVLYYQYAGNTNKLLAVDDASNSLDGFKDDNIALAEADYDYDLNGNMTRDWNKNISSISYNHLNLPVNITFSTPGTNIIEYLYNANGQKLQKTVWQTEATPGAVTVTSVTEYHSGFQYKDAGLEFFPTAEGYVSVSGGTHFNYVFNYTDHLGNIRLSYTDNNGILTPLEENHYYPFGMKHSNYGDGSHEWKRDKITGGIYAVIEPVEINKYKYKYNGKEYQDELGLNFYDYGARNYDPAIGRWMNIDPLAENYFSISPYTYVANNPVRYIDPNGMEIKDPDKIVENYKKQLNQAITDIKSFVKNGTISAEIGDKLIGVNNKFLGEVAALEKSDQVYTVFNDKSSKEGGVSYDKASGEVKIGLGTSDKGLVAHEMGHAYQYEKGEISLFVDNSQFGSLYDLSDETQSYNRERALNGGMEYFTNPNMKWNNSDVKTFGQSMTPAAYQSLPSGPIDINSKEGKALRNKTIEAGKNGLTVMEVYMGWQKDYAKGEKKRK